MMKKSFFKVNFIDINFLDKDAWTGWTPLHAAAEAGHFKVPNAIFRIRNLHKFVRFFSTKD
jgi:hypothetical protein